MMPTSNSYCDLVMKGGITSGIVYPPAVCELAPKYYFRNIGGTSVGAIAAVATAAAELGRRRGLSDSYPRLGKLPDEFARPGFLLALFQPEPDAVRVMQLIFAAWQPSSVLGKALAIVRIIVRHWFSALAVGIALGTAVPVLIYLVRGGPRLSILVLGLLWVLVGTVGVVTYAVVRSVIGTLAKDGFGLCSGYAAHAPATQLPLMNWLHALVAELAGATGEEPVTFKDLWEAPHLDGEGDLSPRVINLEVITTNLTHGRPYRLPLDETEWRGLYFSPEEWSRLFPPDIITWLKRQSRTPTHTVVTADGTSVMPFPDPADLPVIVAARLSMSFPVLFTAVPLWAVDFSRAENQHEPHVLRAERCWFSDGGLSSNFPIHMFDAPVPRWPTFGINLKKPHPEHTSERDMVWLPSNNRQGQSEMWDRWEERRGSSRIAGFALAMLNTMQEWRDNLQTRVPGFRDRIVHVSVGQGEGGLNLDMRPEMVETLTARGRFAGEKLRDAFSWQNHIWVRYRSTMANAEEFVKRLRIGYRYSALLHRFLQSEPSPSYPMESGQREAARQATEAIASGSEAWEQGGQSFATGEPRPPSVLRSTPRV
jgi:predicted acylesterase/phospholipase RssA